MFDAQFCRGLKGKRLNDTAVLNKSTQSYTVLAGLPNYLITQLQTSDAWPETQLSCDTRSQEAPLATDPAEDQV